jgi:hypothetical protein
MPEFLKSVGISSSVYRVIQLKAKKDDRSLRSWLDKFLLESFPDEIAELEFEDDRIHTAMLIKRNGGKPIEEVFVKKTDDTNDEDLFA